MKSALIVASLVVFTMFAGVVLGGLAWYNTGISLQESVKAQFRQNQNSYDAFWKSVRETAQIPEAYKSDFKDLILTEETAKFGEGGSKAMMQWFQEKDIRPDASLYTKVQSVIESGRNDFKRSQTDLLDKQRRLSTHLKNPTGRFYGMFLTVLEPLSGDLAPESDLDGDGQLTVLDYPIVTSKRTKAAFAAGEDDEVEVFGKH